MHCVTEQGPSFGYGNDMCVSDILNTSYTNFPHSYIDTTNKGNNTFTGAKNYTANEIEIFLVLD